LQRHSEVEVYLGYWYPEATLGSIADDVAIQRDGRDPLIEIFDYDLWNMHLRAEEAPTPHFAPPTYRDPLPTAPPRLGLPRLSRTRSPIGVKSESEGLSRSLFGSTRKTNSAMNDLVNEQAAARLQHEEDLNFITEQKTHIELMARRVNALEQELGRLQGFAPTVQPDPIPEEV